MSRNIGKRIGGRVARSVVRHGRSVIRRSSNNATQSVAFEYRIDSPYFSTLEDRRITVAGWLVPFGGAQVNGMRINHDGNYHELPYGFERRDVVKALPQADATKALRSGFTLDIE